MSCGNDKFGHPLGPKCIFKTCRVEYVKLRNYFLHFYTFPASWIVLSHFGQNLAFLKSTSCDFELILNLVHEFVGDWYARTSLHIPF